MFPPPIRHEVYAAPSFEILDQLIANATTDPTLALNGDFAGVAVPDTYYVISAGE